MTDDEIKAGAEALRQTLSVAGGRTSFDYAVRQHLQWFSALLARGLGWAGIIRVLSAAGVHRDDGQPLSRGHLSAVYWRQIHAMQSTDRGASDLAPPGPIARPDDRCLDTESPRSKRTPAVRERASMRTASSDSTSDEARQNRAFMKRAVDLRRSDFDDA